MKVLHSTCRVVALSIFGVTFVVFATLTLHAADSRAPLTWSDPAEVRGRVLWSMRTTANRRSYHLSDHGERPRGKRRGYSSVTTHRRPTTSTVRRYPRETASTSPFRRAPRIPLDSKAAEDRSFATDQSVSRKVW